MSRDWLSTLWLSSYKGASFWVETYTENGARRIVTHEFPMRDDPYLEDLGERYREFTVTAYVASDNADTEAAALMAAHASRGAGILVLPDQGPVLVRCTEFSRSWNKDKMGFNAHELKFVREGFAGALATVASLINLIFVNVEAAAVAAADNYARTAILGNTPTPQNVAVSNSITPVTSVPDYVVQALQTSTETAIATMEAVRTSYNVEPVANAEQREAIAAAYVALPAALESSSVAAPPPSQFTTSSPAATVNVDALQSVGHSVIEIAVALVDSMDPQSALQAMDQIVVATPTATDIDPLAKSKWRGSVAKNTQTGNTLLRMAALIAYCEAIAKVPLNDRQTAITLRANVSMYFESQLGALPSSDYELFRAMVSLRDATIDYISKAVLDLAPVVPVEANDTMPSLYWSWRLYGSATRGPEIVKRNRVEHPSFIPPKFEALRA